jgi:hypothetical protein
MITRNDNRARFFPVPHAWRIALPMLAAVACLGGCATTGPALYANEEFSSADTYSHSFPGTGPATCEAARRALLSQGYIVTESKPALVKGIKNFQRTSEAHAEIEFSVVCAPDSEGSNATTAFANAVRQTYSLKKSSNSASVGVGVLGSLSVPFGSSDDSLVKVGAETISAKKFYDQFFIRVESYLDVPAVEKPAAQVPDAAAPVVPPTMPAGSPATVPAASPATVPAVAPASVPAAAPASAPGATPAAGPTTAPAVPSAPSAPVTPAAPTAPPADPVKS